ncbi:jmjc domain-containing protein 7 [Moniliophthora roreri]|nr:jmjc domain-containing protein 7 [Moniliophthora roreri]
MESLRWLSEEYHDLNGSSFDTLDEPPSALEFSRIVHVSRPVLIKAFRTPASERWTNEYLIDKMGSSQISISASGCNCSRVGRQTLFCGALRPANVHVKFVIKAIGESCQTETYYLQSQNGNIYTSQFYEDGDAPSEYQPLRIDVPSQVSWCTEALDRNPDAVNIWIGDGGSVSSIHSDPYENIYTVVRGVKHFTLLPPTEGWCLEERMYPHATYTRSESGALILQPSSLETPQVRWASIADPHLPGNLPRDAHPIHVTVKSGDTLYLPAGWWHHVRQSGITIALNWWYDIEMRGMNWVLLSFLRSIKQVPSGNKGHIERDDETYD